MKYVTLLALLALTACGGSPGSSQVSAPPPATISVTADVKPALLVMMGDSITEHWNDVAFNDANDMIAVHVPQVADMGICGQVTQSMAERFKVDVLDQNPDTILIEGGTNDIGALGSADTSYLFDMIAEAQASGAHVIVANLPPFDVYGGVPVDHVLADVWRTAITEGAKVYGYQVADYYSVMRNADGSMNLALFNADQLHPNAEGYAVMWNVLKPLLGNAITSATVRFSGAPEATCGG